MSPIIIVAGDVSKGYCDFVAIDNEGKLLLDLFQLDDNRPGHDALSAQLLDLRKTQRAKRILFVVESTGGLEDNWLRTVKRPALADLVEGYRINPKITHHEYRVQKRNSISDAVSAMTIATHVAKNLTDYTPCEVVLDPAYQAAHSLIRHLTSLDKQCTMHKTALQQLLYQYLPSLVPLMPQKWSRYFLEILLKYTSKKSIQRAAAQGFKQIKRVPKGKASMIHQALKNGIDVEETPAMIMMTIRSKVRQILALQEEMKQCEECLLTTSPVSDKQVKLLCSIKGMGQVSATILLSFIQDIDRFDNAKALAAFFGVQPRIKVSGDGSRTVGMSKQGSPLVRRTLYNIAFRTISNEPYLRSLYAKWRQRGKCHNAALGVVMHKVLRIIYGMLKSNTAYDAGVDQLNQVDPRANSEQAVVTTPVKTNKKRRFQPRSTQAPTSRRESKKRKQDQASQAAMEAECAGST